MAGKQFIKRFYKEVKVSEHPRAAQLDDSSFLPQGTVPSLANLSQVAMQDGHERGTYWCISLDERVIKTMYKDDMFIPSRALAVALAEEWESQADVIDLRDFHMNNLLAKGVRAGHDPSLRQHMESELQKIIENDQICFIEPEEGAGSQEYKSKLRTEQNKHIDKVFGIMSDEFGIKLNVFENLYNVTIDPSVLKATQIVQELDPVALTCLYQMAISSKSAAIALCALHGKLSIEEAVRASRIDEDYQIQSFGLVEGAHDLDESYLYTTFGAAKAIVNMAQLREI